MTNQLAAEPVAAPPHDRLMLVASSFRLVLGLSTLLMLALSWPLWVGDGVIPRVPFLAGFDGLPGSWPTYGFVMGSVAMASALNVFASRKNGRVGRRLGPATDLISVGLIVGLVIADQHRLQPWIYQYLLVTLAFAAFSPGNALRLARLFVILLYAYSGLSKLDATFTRELGGLFLNTALRPLGLDPSNWPATGRTAAVLTMPAVEILVAIGLYFHVTRRWALAGAILLHAMLLAILGPWGLGHSTIVLIWNASLIVEDLLLFGPRRLDLSGDDARRSNLSWIEWPVKVVFLMAAVMPLFERRGLWDTWPSFALYASHGERVDIYLADWEGVRLPDSVRAHLGPVGRDGYRRLDVNGWSLVRAGDSRLSPGPGRARSGRGTGRIVGDSPGGARRDPGTRRPPLGRAVDGDDPGSGKHPASCEPVPSQRAPGRNRLHDGLGTRDAVTSLTKQLA